VIPGSYSTFDPEQSIFGSSHNEYYGTDKNDEAEIMLNQYAKIIGFTLHRKQTQGSEQGLELVENDESYDLGNKLDINILVENEQFNNKTDYNFVKQLNNKTDNELVEALQEYEEKKLQKWINLLKSQKQYKDVQFLIIVENAINGIEKY
ncbi:11023_t:CDS:2, partial [Gigaspora rosea]